MIRKKCSIELTVALTILAVTLLASGKYAFSSVSSLPAAAQVKISAAVGQGNPAYFIRSEKNQVTATNPRHSLSSRFTSGGITVSHGASTWGLTLSGCGRGGDLKPVFAAAAAQMNSNRVEYPRGPLTEWYVNGPAGLEQGFTISQPPAQSEGGPLTVALSLSGSMVATVDKDRTGLTLKSHNQVTELRYSGLTAIDAAGKSLRAWLELSGGQLLVRVDDNDAHYPVVIDPLVQLAELTNTNPGFEDDFGYSVAISGNTIVVGDTNVVINGNTAQGAAYVFVKPTSGWANMTQTAELTASDGSANALFGNAVAIDGDTIVVGADNATVNGQPNSGEAYIFLKPASGWADATETATLLAAKSTCLGGCDFGSAVGISGSNVVVGALYATVDSMKEAGAAYVFVKPTDGWKNMTQTAELTANPTSSFALFGVSVAISGNTVVAGAEYQSVVGYKFGGVYVFVEPASGWTDMTQTADLKASNKAQSSFLGRCVAIQGNTIVASASGGGQKNGTLYVYVEPEGGWITSSETAQLKAAGDTAQFGNSLAMSGDMIATASFGGGPVYVFVKPKSGWVTTSKANFTVSAGEISDYFGYSIGASDGTVVAGAPSLPDGPGAAYVFGP
jgi:hypothetical protein